MAKECFSRVIAAKAEHIHITMIPPKAPFEGQKLNLSNLLGAKFLT
jgi:hypothetical protein